MAVELEVPREVSKLLHSVESVYLGIVREVVEYAVANNVTGANQLHGLFYSKYRLEYPSLNSQLIIQAIRQAVQIAKSFVERRKRGLVSKPYPEVKNVSIRFVETAWNYEEFVKSIAPVRIAITNQHQWERCRWQEIRGLVETSQALLAVLVEGTKRGGGISVNAND